MSVLFPAPSSLQEQAQNEIVDLTVQDQRPKNQGPEDQR